MEPRNLVVPNAVKPALWQLTLTSDSIVVNGNTAILTSRDQTRTLYDYLRNRVCNSIFLYECSSWEIQEIIKELDNDKVSDISVRVLISEHLACFFNRFMELDISLKLAPFRTHML